MSTPKPKLSDLWTPAESIEYPTRWSVGLWGPAGGGKSHVIVNSCPGPLFIANFDRDISALVKKSGRKDVYVANLHTEGLVLTDKRAEELIQRFQAAIDEVITMTEGTFALDGGSALHHILEQLELARLNASQHKRGKEIYERLPALHRGAINAQINAMLASVSNSPVNFAITHQQREIWDETGKPTGTFEPRENSQIAYGVDMEVRIFSAMRSAGRDPKTKKPIAASRGFYGRVTLCKHNTSAEDTKIENP
ncbi:unnamed protein product, partial [marine sediment metagenome]